MYVIDQGGVYAIDRGGGGVSLIRGGWVYVIEQGGCATTHSRSLHLPFSVFTAEPLRCTCRIQMPARKKATNKIWYFAGALCIVSTARPMLFF